MDNPIKIGSLRIGDRVHVRMLNAIGTVVDVYPRGAKLTFSNPIKHPVGDMQTTWLLGSTLSRYTNGWDSSGGIFKMEPDRLDFIPMCDFVCKD